MTKDKLQIISRLKKTMEGRAFIEEILAEGQASNYKMLLTDGKDHRDELIGYGNCLRDLVVLFETCDIRLAEMDKPVSEEQSGWA